MYDISAYIFLLLVAGSFALIFAIEFIPLYFEDRKLQKTPLEKRQAEIRRRLQ